MFYSFQTTKDFNIKEVSPLSGYSYKDGYHSFNHPYLVSVEWFRELDPYNMKCDKMDFAFVLGLKSARFMQVTLDMLPDKPLNGEIFEVRNLYVRCLSVDTPEKAIILNSLMRRCQHVYFEYVNVSKVLVPMVFACFGGCFRSTNIQRYRQLPAKICVFEYEELTHLLEKQVPGVKDVHFCPMYDISAEVDLIPTVFSPKRTWTWYVEYCGSRQRFEPQILNVIDSELLPMSGVMASLLILLNGDATWSVKRGKVFRNANLMKMVKDLLL